MSLHQSRVTAQGRYSSEGIHRAVFAKRPKSRKLDDLKQAIRRHAKEKHAGR